MASLALLLNKDFRVTTPDQKDYNIPPKVWNLPVLKWQMRICKKTKQIQIVKLKIPLNAGFKLMGHWIHCKMLGFGSVFGFKMSGFALVYTSAGGGEASLQIWQGSPNDSP